MSSYLNNSLPSNPHNEDEIDLRELFTTLKRYKKSITLVALGVFFVSILYAYFKTDIYQADLSLQIQEESKGQLSDDLMSKAIGLQNGNLDNEIAILQSRFVALKALEKLDIGTRYFTESGFKTVELYKSSPFVVQIKEISADLIDEKFILEPIDKQHFRLSMKPGLMSSLAAVIGLIDTPVEFSKEFTYGSEIVHPYFRMSVQPVGVFTQPVYTFSYVPNEMMYSVLQSSLNVATLSEKASVLFLSYQDNVPQRAQEILTAISNAYEEQSIEIKSASAEKTLGFIDEQLQAINRTLQNSATNLKDYKSRHIVVDLKDKASIAAQKMDQLETQLYELDMQQSVLKNLLSYLQNNKEITGIDVGSATASSSPILSLIEKIQAANTLQASLTADYTEKHPSVIKVGQQIVSLKASLRATIESSLRGIQQRRSTLNEIINKNKMSLESLPEQEKQLSQLTRSFLVNEKVYEYLLQKRVETAIVESSTVSGVRVIDDSLVGSQAVKPKRLLLVFVGLLIGILLGVAQALIRNYMLHMIQTINDVRKNTALPIIGVLPYFSNKRSLYGDALRKMFTKVKNLSLEPKTQVITFVSSIYGEGKTTTAYEFANVIANTGKKVILLDMDMRRGNLHTVLNIPNHKGVLTYLSHQSTLEESIQKVQLKLDVMTVGMCETCSYDLLSSDTFTELLSHLRQQYDYVIFVSPPLGIVADALILMETSDLSLVVIRAEYSKKEFVNEINIYMQEHELHNVGFVLNGLELSQVRPWRKKQR